MVGADGNCGWKCFPFTFGSEALPHMELLRHVRQIEKQSDSTTFDSTTYESKALPHIEL